MSNLTEQYISAELLAKAAEKDLRIEIECDEHASSPRSINYQELSSVFVTGGRSYLGDERMTERFNNIDDAVACWAKNRGIQKNYMLWWPVYKYEHGSVDLSLTPYSCAFDSGIVGFIYESKAALRKEFGVKRIGNKFIAKIEKRIKGELLELTSYANGEVYEVLIYDADDDVINSCGGVYGKNESHFESLADELLNEYQCA